MRSIWIGAGIVAGVWLLASRAMAATAPQEARNVTQQKFIKLITAEAQKQGVPVEFALANAEVESNFQDIKAANGESYGPLQVHISALQPGETVAQLKAYAWNIPRGVLILKQRLVKAGGDSELARIMYFCGPGWKTSCSDAALERLRARWRPVAAKWGVQPRY